MCIFRYTIDLGIHRIFSAIASYSVSLVSYNAHCHRTLIAIDSVDYIFCGIEGPFPRGLAVIVDSLPYRGFVLYVQAFKPCV